VLLNSCGSAMRNGLAGRVARLEATQSPGRIWVVYPEAHETTAEALARQGIDPQPQDRLVIVVYEDGPGSLDHA
jgi:hypothetical protein